MAKKIKINDKIVVITGKYKGRKGIVSAFIKKKKVIVKNINIVKKHQKAITEKNIPGGIIKKEMPIDVSNLAIYNKYTKKADRVGFCFKKGKKFRFLKSNKKIIN